MTDNELVQACIQNDSIAQKQLFEQYAAMLLGVCFRYAHSQEEAEEILQLGFIKIFKNIKKIQI